MSCSGNGATPSGKAVPWERACVGLDFDPQTSSIPHPTEWQKTGECQIHSLSNGLGVYVNVTGGTGATMKFAPFAVFERDGKDFVLYRHVRALHVEMLLFRKVNQASLVVKHPDINHKVVRYFYVLEKPYAKGPSCKV